MRLLRQSLTPLALLLVLAAVPAAAQGADTALVADARAFMDAYGQDLASGRRDEIAARYDRRGAYIMFNAQREFAEWEAIRQQYRTEWEPPAEFEWMNLVFEPAGPDAVVVNGLFFWTVRPGELPMRFRYTALLVRQDGALRIRLEDESMAPVTPLPPARQD